MSEEGKRVAVIGAGVSGLCSLKHLLTSETKFIPTCFERGNDIGGMWLYSDNTHKDKFGMPVTSCIYNGLVCNIPKQLMEFPDFPHLTHIDHSFLTRQEILDYLQRFTETFKLREHIRTHTFVSNVSPTGKDKNTKWIVSYYDIRHKDNVHQELFDAVIVCNGHNLKTYTPEVQGLDGFKGEVIHSQNYRHPEHFKDKNVVILGASFSGLDIAVGLSAHSKQVYLSHLKEPHTSTFPKNVHEKTGIKRMKEKGVLFLDDTEEEVDALIFCTGYRYEVPFLKSDIIEVKNNRLTPLYKHMIHTKYHTLLFVGVPSLLSYLPQNYFQSKVAVTILNGTVRLPSENDMLEESEKDYNERMRSGLKEIQGHFMGDGDRQWRYNKDLAQMCELDPYPKYMDILWKNVIADLTSNFTTFRKKKYLVKESTPYVELN